jgi:diguanylate cyclase (GGDEF)-like protein/PAS domain S-box-containing protein
VELLERTPEGSGATATEPSNEPLPGSNGPPGGPAWAGERGEELDYQSILERIPAVTYVAGFGESGRWHYVSPQIESMLGFSASEWRNNPDLWFRQIHPQDRGRALEEEATSKVSGQPLASEYRLVTRDERILWVRDEAVLVRDDGGEPLFWQGFMFDITRRKEIEEALHESGVRFSTLFDRVPVGLYRTTPAGELQDGNRALAQILGFPSKEALIASDTQDLYVDPADRERWMAQVESEETVRDFETQLRRADGSVIWVRDSARAIRDREDRIVCYEGVLQDITRQKQAEWEARQANQQLSSWVSELERRNREAGLINDMGDMLQTCPTPEEAYTVMAHWADQLFPGYPGALFVISPSRNLVEPVAVWGEQSLADTVFSPEDCWALRSGRQHLVQGSSLCVPMMAQGEALGILHLQAGAGGAFAPDLGEHALDGLTQLATAVSEHLALALANLRLRETLRTQSIRDPLTALFNRRYMEESLERELRRAERRNHQIGVVMLDLDNFNTFNNSFGHQAGDALLQAVGELLRTSVRSEDIACRFGGEEFTLILPEASQEITLNRAEQIRAQLRELRLHHRGQAMERVTVSAGVAVFPRDGRTSEALIRAADVALYRAKSEGRDRVVVAGEPTSQPELGPA